MEGLASLLPFVLILAVFWLLLVRPARRRQREVEELQRRLAVGDEVMTTSGLYGRVVGLDGDVVSLETSPGVTTRWARPAIARIVGDAAPGTGSTSLEGDGEADRGQP